MHPRGAHLQGVATQAFVCPGSAADPVAGLEHRDVDAGGFELSGSNQSGEARADNDHRARLVFRTI